MLSSPFSGGLFPSPSARSRMPRRVRGRRRGGKGPPLPRRSLREAHVRTPTRAPRLDDAEQKNSRFRPTHRLGELDPVARPLRHVRGGCCVQTKKSELGPRAYARRSRRRRPSSSRSPPLGCPTTASCAGESLRRECNRRRRGRAALQLQSRQRRGQRPEGASRAAASSTTARLLSLPPKSDLRECATKSFPCRVEVLSADFAVR